MQIGPYKKKKLAMWPLARLRRRQGEESAGVPARGLTGGELEVAREFEEVKAHRLVGLVRAGVFPTARCVRRP